MGHSAGMTRVLFLALLLLPGLASAQVSVDSGALDRLQPDAAPAHKPVAPVRPPAHHPAHPAPRHPAPAAAEPPARPRATKLKPGAPPTIAVAPPAAAVLPPPQVVAPSHPAPPPPVSPIVPDAAGVVTAIKGGIRITFGGGAFDLNAQTDAAIRSLASKMKADAAADVNVYAFAAGVPDDPSTPRRLSLARALAVRAVLISEGIVSTRIYPRALGTAPNPAGGEGPPDRVDMVLANTAPTTP